MVSLGIQSHALPTKATKAAKVVGSAAFIYSGSATTLALEFQSALPPRSAKTAAESALATLVIQSPALPAKSTKAAKSCRLCNTIRQRLSNDAGKQTPGKNSQSCQKHPPLARHRDGPVPDGPARDGPVHDGPVRDGHVRDGPARVGPVRDGPVRDGPAHSRVDFFKVGCHLILEPFRELNTASPMVLVVPQSFARNVRAKDSDLEGNLG